MFDKQTTNLEHDYMKINFHNKLEYQMKKFVLALTILMLSFAPHANTGDHKKAEANR